MPLTRLALALCLTGIAGMAARDTTPLSLCEVFPDPRILAPFCGVRVERTTIGSVASSFGLTGRLDSTASALVVLKTSNATLSLSTEFSAMDDEAARLSASAAVGSLLLRRYFSDRHSASVYADVLVHRIRSAFDCGPDALMPDTSVLVCRARDASDTSIRYLWTNWADDSTVIAPFEISITARFLP